MKYDPETGLLCFSTALVELKRGQCVTRSDWPVAHPVSLTDGVLMIRLSDEEIFPWFPTQADLLAEDWIQLV